MLQNTGYRDDYVYRSALVRRILLGRHSLRTATLIQEMRVETSKADAVVLNGTSTAYEIKSDRDSLGRLGSQLDSYRKVFASVCVVTSELHLDQVQNIAPEDVGIQLLTRRQHLHTVRRPTNAPERLTPTAILESLRADEAAAILRNLGIEVPDVPNTRLRTTLQDLFSSLEPATLHREMVATLRTTRSQAHLAEYVDSIPSSLKAIALTVELKENARARFAEALHTPTESALAWS
ncbi:sce7726 family protein [Nesterenkonia sp. F]|uniref:sce7726 family protein n=1 Tax=Nesterenkonia sp. F TaxID=795955 RepID=UPI003510CB7E